MSEMSVKEGLTAMDVASFLRRHPGFLGEFPDIGDDTLTEYLNPNSQVFFALTPSADFFLVAGHREVDDQDDADQRGGRD